MGEKTPVYETVRKNEEYIRKQCEDCADIIIRPMRLGDERKVECLVVYLEVAVSNMMLEDSVIGKLINHFWEIPPGKMKEFLKDNSLGISDVKELPTLEEAMGAMLAGNAIFFMDGYDRAIKIASKGYPSMGVGQAQTEKVLRGSKEGFTDSVKINSALIRKRLKDARMKVVERQMGIRSNTMLQLLYVDDLVQEDLLDEIQKRLDEFEIDGIFDSGMVEQLTEEVLCKIKTLNEIAEQRGQTLAEMALAWVLKDDLVTSVIIGASSVGQLEDNLKAINNTSFTEEERRIISD